MENNQSRYEIYIEHGANQALGSVVTHWIWRKLNGAGLVDVHGTHHGSLEACFASVRKHRDECGDAPITINLRQGHASDASKDVVAAFAQRDIPSPGGRSSEHYDSRGLRPRQSQAPR